MSRPYNSNNEMRVWGWIPKKLPSAQNFENRDAIVQAIYLNLREKYNIQVWREMNSARDTVIRDNIDVNVFLRTLLGLEEDPNA
jgi:hypothetical protein